MPYLCAIFQTSSWTLLAASELPPNRTKIFRKLIWIGVVEMAGATQRDHALPQQPLNGVVKICGGTPEHGQFPNQSLDGISRHRYRERRCGHHFSSRPEELIGQKEKRHRHGVKTFKTPAPAPHSLAAATFAYATAPCIDRWSPAPRPARHAGRRRRKSTPPRSGSPRRCRRRY